ncbi:PHD finger family protein [Artemisia annua]|uniref:PHD finger family protein n=1 Tax=Artemisia annua TaxID=35608 RepID=A0A2U1L3G5_ARTAN|nr:PHD finger family protein [Artemisia annua]PWA43520.1 PHD finger family protein [Artemisia annua]
MVLLVIVRPASIWKKRSPSDTGIDFRLHNILMKNKPNGHLLAPRCQLCAQRYTKDLMYICCEKCKIDVVGYGYLFTEPEERNKLESRRAALEKSVRGRYMDTEILILTLMMTLIWNRILLQPLTRWRPEMFKKKILM